MQTTRRDFLRGAATAAAALAVSAARAPAAAKSTKPNVLFILADDLGWMDTSLYGSKYYQTPNIDRLARRGMMFTDAYAANPLCSPTRASILTGMYPCRFAITTPAGHLPPLDTPLMPKRSPPWAKMICPRSRRFLPPEERTLAEMFKDAGYHTGFIGKWHLGLRPPHWPEKQGFDFSFHGAPDPGPRSYFSPYRFGAGTVTDGPKGEYITDRIADEACKYIDAHKDEPWLLCFWQYAVHAPFQAKEDLTAKYRKKTDPRGKQDCPIMGGMIHSLDQAVGRVLDKLDELKLAGNTIIVFFSDNGGNMYNTVEGTTPTNNHPLRSGKGNIHEGGVREPCVVIWPGVVKAGSNSGEVITSVDFYPTLLEMIGRKPRKGKILDGESLVPVLTGEERLKREAIFCHFPHYIKATGNLPSTSVRKGHWKLIRVYGEGDDREEAFELYNLKTDIGEANNLAEKMPEKVKELDALIDAHLKETKAIVPIKNPNYDARAAQVVGGWRSSGDARLATKGGSMHVNSTGRDPFLWTEKVPAHAGPLVVKIRMKSATAGPMQIFWGTREVKRFHRSRSVVVKLTHDGKWHDYEATLPIRGKLAAFRIDPGTAKGQIEIDAIRLCKPDGSTVKAWEF